MGLLFGMANVFLKKVAKGLMIFPSFMFPLRDVKVNSCNNTYNSKRYKYKSESIHVMSPFQA